MTRPPHKREHDPANPHIEEEESDFQAFLRGARDLFDRYGTPILLAVLIVLLAVVVTRWYSGREQRMLEEAYGELAAATSPLSKQDVASRYEHVPGLAGRAYLSAGDMLLREAMGLPPLEQPQAEPPELSDEERAEKLQQAEQLYQRVIERNASALQVNNARFGLAAVYEMRGEFDAAAEQYELILEDEREKGDPYGHGLLAADLRGNLDRVARPVDFPEAPARSAMPDDAAHQGLQLGPDASGDELPDLPFTLEEGAPQDSAPPTEPVIPEAEPADEAPADDDAPFDTSDLNIGDTEEEAETP